MQHKKLILTSAKPTYLSEEEQLNNVLSDLR